MTTISTAELANQLPHILQAIASGEEFLVTEAGRPIARITPPSPMAAGRVLSGEAWQRELDEFCRRAQLRSNRYPPGFVLDDSRETIYGERENTQL